MVAVDSATSDEQFVGARLSGFTDRILSLLKTLWGLFQTEPCRTDEDALPIAVSWSERRMIRSY